MAEIFDVLGIGYASRRQPDPRIASLIRQQLAGCQSIVNIGAGTGSYEPEDLQVVAVEPSRQMILQRRNANPVVQAKAEALPFGNKEFDAAMAILTIHHWTDKMRGLAECLRVSRKSIVILTWDPSSEGFWLVQDYFPQIIALDRALFPALEEFRSVLGEFTSQPVPIPADCSDGFLGAYWKRPEAYLDPSIRSAISTFQRIGDVEDGLRKLQEDIGSGRWHDRYRHLLQADTLDVGYRLIRVEVTSQGKNLFAKSQQLIQETNDHS